MRIVFADADTLGADISLEKFKTLGEIEVYGFTKPDELKMRCDGADVVITNKVPINEKTLGESPTVKFVGVTATGTNVIDFDYTKKHGITVTNVKGYSTESVAQHTFSLLFYLLEKSHYYDTYVKEEGYVDNVLFNHLGQTFSELYGKTWGIVGLGEIGRRVADIAKAFGCNVIYYSTSGKNSNDNYNRVDFDTLLSTSDIVSVHAPLNKDTENLFDDTAFDKMKKNAIFINVGRGPIVNEQALYDALAGEKIAGAGLDVLCEEPMSRENPLLQFKDSNRLIITPHIAWATVEARNRLIQEVYLNLSAFTKGEKRNVIE